MDGRKSGAHGVLPSRLGAGHEERVQCHLVDVFHQHDFNKVLDHRVDQAEAQRHAITLSSQCRLDLRDELLSTSGSHPLATAKQTRAQRRRTHTNPVRDESHGTLTSAITLIGLVTLIGLDQVCGREVLTILKVLHV